MSSQFTIDNQDMDDIAKSMDVGKDVVTFLKGEYDKLNILIKDQYLAHLIYSLEEIVREKKNAPGFVINCRPSTANPSISGKGCASYDEGVCYNIVYDAGLDDKQARVVIAHELGHLFLMLISDKDFGDMGEALASILGIFTIVDKNNFYSNKGLKSMHKSVKEVTNDFSQLVHGMTGRPNIS